MRKKFKILNMNRSRIVYIGFNSISVFQFSPILMKYLNVAVKRKGNK